MSRLQPIRKDALVRPRDRSEEERVRARQAAVAARKEQRRLLTPPVGWSNGDRTATGEAAEWARFMTALKEARASGADILGLASRVWFAPRRSRPEAPPVEPAIWTGPENPYVGNPKLTPDMVAEMKILRAQGWSTGKLAKRYGVTRATICYALLGRTSHHLPANRSPAPPERLREPEAVRPRQLIVDGAQAEGPGWSDAARLMTGEGEEWKQFRAAMKQAIENGADVIGASSDIFSVPYRRRHDCAADRAGDLGRTRLRRRTGPRLRPRPLRVPGRPGGAVRCGPTDRPRQPGQSRSAATAPTRRGHPAPARGAAILSANGIVPTGARRLPGRGQACAAPRADRWAQAVVTSAPPRPPGTTCGTLRQLDTEAKRSATPVGMLQHIEAHCSTIRRIRTRDDASPTPTVRTNVAPCAFKTDRLGG